MAVFRNSTQLVDTSSRQAPYRLGLLDPSIVASLTIDPLDAPCFTLLVPCQDHTFTALLTDPAFQGGAICGYTFGELEQVLEDYPVAFPVTVVNWVWNAFVHEVRREDCSYAWLVGYLLGELSGLAETDHTLSLVGLAHLDYLLSLVPACPLPLAYPALRDAGWCHDQAVCAYRAAVRSHKAQGLDSFHASRAALAGLAHASALTLSLAASEVA